MVTLLRYSFILTSAKLMQGLIDVLSPLTVQNGFVRPLNLDPSNTMVPLAHMSQPLRRHLNRFSRTWPADRQTDRPHYSMCSNRPLLLATAAMRPNDDDDDDDYDDSDDMFYSDASETCFCLDSVFFLSSDFYSVALFSRTAYRSSSRVNVDEGLWAARLNICYMCLH